MTFQILADGEYRIFADGWWADVKYEWDRETGEWRVAILDSNGEREEPVAVRSGAAERAIPTLRNPEST